MTFHSFSGNKQILEVLAIKLRDTPKHASLLEKLLVFVKSIILQAFSGNERLFATFRQKIDENDETW